MASMFTPQALMGAITSPEFGWRTTHFWGPIANWGLVVAGVYDATKKGPEVISLNMTSTLCVYSALFMRFAWKVQPRNYLLLSCHAFNEAVQLWQFKRGYEYQQTLGKELSFKESADENIARQPAPAGFNFPLFGAAIGTGVAATAAGQTIKERLMAATFLPESARTIMNHPAGPFTIHFWAPTMKWMLSVSNLLDYDRPVENVSTLQQTALCATGFIWSRYAMVINPVNYNLFAVNVSLAITGTYHLGRKVKASMATEKEEKEL